MTFLPRGIFDSTAGTRMEFVVNEETLTLNTGGLDTDSSASLIPANSIVLGVAGEVTTTITGPTTLWRVGAPATTGRFIGNQTTLTAGYRTIGLEQMSGASTTAATGPTQTSAAVLRVNVDAIPTAGAVRLTVYAIKFL